MRVEQYVLALYGRAMAELLPSYYLAVCMRRHRAGARLARARIRVHRFACHMHGICMHMHCMQVPDWLGGKATGWAHGCGGPVPSGAGR